MKYLIFISTVLAAVWVLSFTIGHGVGYGYGIGVKQAIEEPKG